MSNLLCGGCCANSLNGADIGITVLPTSVASDFLSSIVLIKSEILSFYGRGRREFLALLDIVQRNFSESDLSGVRLSIRLSVRPSVSARHL